MSIIIAAINNKELDDQNVYLSSYAQWNGETMEIKIMNRTEAIVHQNCNPALRTLPDFELPSHRA